MPRRPIWRVAAALCVAVLGGAIGAALVWLSTGRITWSAAGVAVFGWLVTFAGWFISARLSERAQRRMFLHNLINTARGEIIGEIRAGQDWVTDLNSIAFRSRLALEKHKMLPISDDLQRQLFWHDQAGEAHKMLYSQRGAPHRLLTILEEYELLFPETRQVRSQLCIFAQARVMEPFSRSIIDLGIESLREQAISDMQVQSDQRMDYAAVLEDLRVHVQNASLATITGGRVPKRSPLDPTVPIMVAKSDGMLDIVERGESWPARTAAPESGSTGKNADDVNGLPRPPIAGQG